MATHTYLECEYLYPGLCDEDGVLELGGPRVVLRDGRPAVLQHPHPRPALAHRRLHRERLHNTTYTSESNTRQFC